MLTYYQILGVHQNATFVEIKAAYRKLVLKHHPDRNNRNTNANLQFQQIRLAYETLIDHDKRKNYDLSHLGISNNFKSALYAKKSFSAIKIKLSKRIVTTEDTFELIVRTSIPTQNINIAGLDLFTIIKGPEYFKASTEEYDAESTLTQVKYSLKPLANGYISIGPASVIIRNIRYESDVIFIKVNDEGVEPVKKNYTKSERVVYGFAIGIFMLIFALIIYNISQYGIKPDEFLTDARPYLENNEYHLNTGDIPYKLWSYYYDINSNNIIRIKNKKNTDTVIFINDFDTKKTVRNHYLKKGDEYSIAKIPDGKYYIKTLSGNDWNYGKKFNEYEGNFNLNNLIEEYTKNSEIITLEHQYGINDTKHSVYEIVLKDK